MKEFQELRVRSKYLKIFNILLTIVVLNIFLVFPDLSFWQRTLYLIMLCNNVHYATIDWIVFKETSSLNVVNIITFIVWCFCLFGTF